MKSYSLRLNVQLDNEAFAECGGIEVARILREIARHVEPLSDVQQSTGPKSVRDFNGNKCGSWSIEAIE